MSRIYCVDSMPLTEIGKQPIEQSIWINYVIRLFYC